LHKHEKKKTSLLAEKRLTGNQYNEAPSPNTKIQSPDRTKTHKHKHKELSINILSNKQKHKWEKISSKRKAKIENHILRNQLPQ
jgi:hypothetical protein